MKVIIIGAGFSGIGMAIQLKRSGFNDFLVLEQAPSVGGTWRDNTYPGAACDVASHLYSFSFYQNPRWSKSYAPWNEIRDYLEECVDVFHIRSHIRCSSEVEQCVYLHDDPEGFVWSVSIKGNPVAHKCHFIVSGAGALSTPAVPKFNTVRGGFQGPSFHTAQWDHTVDLTGKHIAIIGTGASAIQVIPEVTKIAKQVTVFQRTAPWVIRKRDGVHSGWMRAVYTYVPPVLWASRLAAYADHELTTILIVNAPNLFQRAVKLTQQLLSRHVTDPVRKEQLTPKFNIGCKRILLSNEYYPAMASSKVDIVNGSIESIAPEGVVTTDGKVHPADVLVYATGFEVHNMQRMPSMVGRHGVDLRDAWAGEDGMYAYLGTFIHGFPNVGILLGPNTGLGTNSIVFMIECQINMIIEQFKHMRRAAVTRMEVRRDVEKAFNDRVQAATQGTLWLSGCRSWYLNEKGRNTTLWPYTTLRYWWETSRVGTQPFVYSA